MLDIIVGKTINFKSLGIVSWYEMYLRESSGWFEERFKTICTRI